MWEYQANKVTFDATGMVDRKDLTGLQADRQSVWKSESDHKYTVVVLYHLLACLYITPAEITAIKARAAMRCANVRQCGIDTL